MVRAAILGAVPDNETGVEFKRLPALVKKHLSEADLQRLCSLSWYTTTVKLDLEVRGEIERIHGSKPQRITTEALLTVTWTKETSEISEISEVCTGI